MYNSKAVLPIKDPADILWLAGLLEGEGSFVLCQGRIRIALVMTDKDIVEKAGAFMDAPCIPLKRRAEHHKHPYSCRVTGYRAAYYMRLILPFMGERRAAKIRECLSHFDQSVHLRKEQAAAISRVVSDDVLIRAWQNKPADQSFRAFARGLGVSARTGIQKRLRRLGLLRSDAPELPDSEGTANLFELSERNKFWTGWIAGLLEGEGCFLFAANVLTISLKMTDEDVVKRFCELIGSNYRVEAARRITWKASFVVTLSGIRAAEVMRTILPEMGARRTMRIQECLSKFRERNLDIEVNRAKRAAHLPLDEFKSRWENRQPGESLLKISREFGVHPQSLKGQLLKLGVYKVPSQKLVA